MKNPLPLMEDPYLPSTYRGLSSFAMSFLSEAKNLGQALDLPGTNLGRTAHATPLLGRLSAPQEQATGRH